MIEQMEESLYWKHIPLDAEYSIVLRKILIYGL